MMNIGTADYFVRTGGVGHFNTYMMIIGGIGHLNIW
jgi:hypothetical protein